MVPSIFDDLDENWWGDAQILEDIANNKRDSVKNKKNLFKNDKELVKNKPERWKRNTEWKDGTSVKNKFKNKVPTPPKQTNLKKRLKKMGTIVNIVKVGCGFIQCQETSEMFTFSNTKNFKKGDTVSFEVSLSKSNSQNFRKAVKIKLKVYKQDTLNDKNDK
tara:strand:+ start:6730 stop:7215 length:486 start_codon:yes stop_codon:yes gene_type:complete